LLAKKTGHPLVSREFAGRYVRRGYFVPLTYYIQLYTDGVRKDDRGLGVVSGDTYNTFEAPPESIFPLNLIRSEIHINNGVSLIHLGRSYINKLIVLSFVVSFDAITVREYSVKFYINSIYLPIKNL